MIKKPKYPISDADMQVLLKKYPFLRYRNVYSGKQLYHGKSKNLSRNYYKEFDDSGWEDLWKNRYLPRLFKVYDAMDKNARKKFGFLEVKEKFGTLRIYVTYAFYKERLEPIAESLSGWICQFCGKEPREDGKRVIWTTEGYITNLCEDCARKCLKEYDKLPDDQIEEELARIKHYHKPFGFKRYGSKKITEFRYRETDDGWLEIDEIVESDRADT